MLICKPAFAQTSVPVVYALCLAVNKSHHLMETVSVMVYYNQVLDVHVASDWAPSPHTCCDADVLDEM